MAGDALPIRITDGESHCLVADPAVGSVHAPVVEINLQGVLLKCDLQLEANAYIDVKLMLKGANERQLFGHVVSSGGQGLRLRWVFFDPGDEARLRVLLDEFQRSVSRGDGTGGRRTIKMTTTATDAVPAVVPSGTRRVVRPKTTTITPFSDEPDKPTSAPESQEGKSNQRVGTRRVLKPMGGSTTPSSGSQAVTPFGQIEITPFGSPVLPPEPPPKAEMLSSLPAGLQKREDVKVEKSTEQGEESRIHHVVIQPTDQFVKMQDIREPIRERTPTQQPALEPVVSGKEGQPVVDSGAESVFHGAAGDGAKAKMVRSGDGKMDIGASIRSHAKTVRASELAARHDRVRVLNMATIKALIQEAVEEAATLLTANLGENERKRLLEEAEEGFKERMKAFQAEKMDAEGRAKELARQLNKAQDLLEEERKRQISANQFTMSQQGVQQLDDHFEQVLSRSIAAGRVSTQLEEQLKKLFSHVLDQEREKIREKELEAQNSKIALLEKKIGRLADSLEETEKQRDHAQRLASVLEKQGGALRNVFEAGIDDDDAAKEKKLALMKVIFDDNRKLRESLGLPLHVVTAVAPAEVAAAVAAAQTAVPAAAEPEPVAEADSASEPETPAEDAVNPDDEPWEVKPLAGIHGGMTSSGIKQMDVSALVSKAPPPLQVKTPDAPPAAVEDDQAVALGDDVPLNPDDEPWEVTPLDTSGGGATGGVKQMDLSKLVTKEPPPLKRR